MCKAECRIGKAQLSVIVVIDYMSEKDFRRKIHNVSERELKNVVVTTQLEDNVPS